jgi:hypothetical protein
MSFFSSDGVDCCDECGGIATVELELPSETINLCLDCVEDIKQSLDICDKCGDGLCNDCAEQAFPDEDWQSFSEDEDDCVEEYF